MGFLSSNGVNSWIESFLAEKAHESHERGEQYRRECGSYVDLLKQNSLSLDCVGSEDGSCKD